MTDKERISATVDPEVKEYLKNLDGTMSERINEMAKEDMMTNTMSTREKLEAEIEELTEEIEDLRSDIEAKEEQRDELLEKLDEMDEREEEQLEQVYEGLRILKGTKPDDRETNAGNAAQKAGVPEDDLLRMAEDIDLGHYAQGGFPDDISDGEKQAADEWVDSHF